jgi:hypothetical protein
MGLSELFWGSALVGVSGLSWWDKYVQRHSDLARGRHEELAHLHVDAVAVSCVASGFCKSPLRRFSRRR